MQVKKSKHTKVGLLSVIGLHKLLCNFHAMIFSSLESVKFLWV